MSSSCYISIALQIRDLETELEAEQRRGRDVGSELRKLQRLLAEQKQQTEDERRLATEANEQINQLQIRVKTLKRQLAEAVCALSFLCNSNHLADSRFTYTSTTTKTSTNCTFSLFHSSRLTQPFRVIIVWSYDPVLPSLSIGSQLINRIVNDTGTQKVSPILSVLLLYRRY